MDSADLFLKQYDSPATQRTYGHAILSFLSMVGKPEHEVTYSDVVAWRDSLRSSKPNTAYTRWTAVQSYFAWLARTGAIPFTPFAVVRGPSRTRNATPRVPADEEMHALISVEASDPRDIRDKTAVLLCANGLRIAEVVGLRWEDVLVEGEEVTIRVLGKGNKERIIPLSKFCAKALLLWHDAAGTAAGHVFRDYVTYEPMTTRQLQSAFDRIAHKAGVVGLSPHKLRHHYATRLIRAGADVFSVQKLLGHSSVATTQVYVNLDLRDLKRAINLDPL